MKLKRFMRQFGPLPGNSEGGAWSGLGVSGGKGGRGERWTRQLFAMTGLRWIKQIAPSFGFVIGGAEAQCFPMHGDDVSRNSLYVILQRSVLEQPIRCCAIIVGDRPTARGISRLQSDLRSRLWRQQRLGILSKEVTVEQANLHREPAEGERQGKLAAQGGGGKIAGRRSAVVKRGGERRWR
ncbi:hypothetical protein BO94DRAFT_363950 [Aspergillus sclerotioniger CBS 115572]|uniref:Uncharacterized protein n=1 Tax=Aspergillus sclerotioniger CBS 115572 TaxID=1450535 RepID=A0A317X3P9_9EURO|nr:hypothetical protein BO94DRAFT_363950 [Aspergillus sclerotioniger CBS 115572]PWY93239.1 hypothetical protein BO94DRAFT_363950 [Aspergillus sclerotioniger CBS 115572]